MELSQQLQNLLLTWKGYKQCQLKKLGHQFNYSSGMAFLLLCYTIAQKTKGSEKNDKLNAITLVVQSFYIQKYLFTNALRKGQSLVDISKQRLQNIRSGLSQIVEDSGSDPDYLPLLSLSDSQINRLVKICESLPFEDIVKQHQTIENKIKLS